MVTFITDKLQNQSLDDLAPRSPDSGQGSAQKLNHGSGPLSPSESSRDDRHPGEASSGALPIRSQATSGPTFSFPLDSCGAPGAVRSVGPGQSSGPPEAPPSKRHCPSLSAPDEAAGYRSPWCPRGSRVWTVVSKRYCRRGGSAFRAARPSSPPVPRPASASSAFLDSSGGGSGPPWCPTGPYALSSLHHLSQSQEHLAGVASPPPLPRRGLLRSHSQPCMLGGRKRRREEDTLCPRPSLDFLKMTQMLKDSQRLGPPDHEGEDDGDIGGTAVVSSPRDQHDPPGLVTRRGSPWAAQGLGACAGGGDAAPSDRRCEDEAARALALGELDLEQIEND